MVKGHLTGFTVAMGTLMFPSVFPNRSDPIWHVSSPCLFVCFCCWLFLYNSLCWMTMQSSTVCTHFDHNQINDPLPFKSYKPNHYTPFKSLFHCCLLRVQTNSTYCTKQHISYCWQCPHREATASFKDLATVAQENSTNQTSDVLVEDQLQPPSRTWQQLHRRTPPTKHQMFW